jgi:CRP/FNR family cyclic AMP-dependent transcriptional regulator
MAADPRITDALAATDLFSGLDKRALGRVAEKAKLVKHQAGKAFAEGTTGIAFHLILDGTVEVSVRDRQPLSFGPGQYFGDISLIDGKPRSATVTAATDVTTASIVSWEFEPLLLEEPVITKALLLVMCQRLRRAEQPS